MGRFGHVFMWVNGDLKDRGQRPWICRQRHEAMSNREEIERRRVGVVMVVRSVMDATNLGIDVMTGP